jgi:aspartate kinase
MIVMKFGGTSIQDAAAIKQVAEIVRTRLSRRPVIVVSAMAGVTDALIRCAEEAHQGHEQEALQQLDALTARHLKTSKELIQDPSHQRRLNDAIESHSQEIQMLLRGLALLGELTPRSLDAVAAYGERLSSLLLVEALRSRELEAEWADAREWMITDDQFTRANPLMDLCSNRARELISPLLKKGKIPVTQGFIGATQDGRTTTLGRGGSDYSAAVLGALLDAEEVEIWTDVNGVMTADPRIVPEAHTISQLSYAEAAELAYFGAKVLHPKTILPAIERGIPLRILNTFSPEKTGTRIVRQVCNDGRTVKAITAIRGLSLVTVEGRGMLGVPGVAAKVFTAVARESVNVLMISQSSSEQSICFVVETGSAARALKALHEVFELELARRNIDRIEAQEGVAIVAVVGAGMRGTPGIGAKVFGALGHSQINVISVAQGSSEHNLSLVVREEDASKAIREIHQEFQLGKVSQAA